MLNIVTARGLCVCPHLRGGGGIPSQVWGGGYPIPGLGGGWGVPHLRSGGTPSKVWVGGYPIPGLGGYPISGLGRGYPGYPHTEVWMVGGTPSQVWIVGGAQGTPPPMRQSSIASTCYAAGGVPLAFTQEDFLVERIYDF